MALIKYEVANLPEETVGHNLGDVLGVIWVGKKVENPDYCDEQAEVCCEVGLPYFKAKGAIVPIPAKALPVVNEK
jgi:hypothetical protein